MKTIVLGYDGSPEAARALERTAELARVLGARAIVTSVAPVLSLARHEVDALGAGLPDRHRLLADDAASTLGEQGVSATARPGLGDPAEAIVRLAEAEGADLIVVGMSHRSHLSRILGSVSDDVAHRAHCDVVLVR